MDWKEGLAVFFGAVLGVPLGMWIVSVVERLLRRR